ncbi:DivIVA domain-containing protein [Actinomadura barringtoniae]|uniref:DivIVA domain-containing protein n=1 Tax=Actinomadura barringtoniae TaxID=1427535 RepID=A0A939PPE3_9ACTN|nr:DivIVA domain-containing protein [Actinomadura barringtoniae]MBO2453689.1 DivIVA domain-containing protein [Actinomadura barringtoniae]
MPEFSVVLRGYDRRQVDEVVARVEGTLGRAPLYGRPVTLKEFGWIEYDVVARGYDRFEVDGQMRNYRRELAAREGVELAYEPEQDAGLSLVLGSGSRDPGDSLPTTDPLTTEIRGEHSFPIRFRGYDRAQVNALIARIWGTLGRVPLEGEPVTREELNNPRLDIVIRGYDRTTVDQAIGRYLRDLLDRSR